MIAQLKEKRYIKVPWYHFAASLIRKMIAHFKDPMSSTKSSLATSDPTLALRFMAHQMDFIGFNEELQNRLNHFAKGRRLGPLWELDLPQTDM